MTDRKNNKKEPAVPTAPAAVRMEAVSWFEALNRGPLSEAQTFELKVWLRADPAHAEAFRNLEQTWRDLALLEGAEEWAASGSRNAQSVRRPAWRRPAVWASAMAACFALGVVSLTFTLWPGAEGLAVARYSTEIAETRTVVLEDETKIYLSGESVVEVAYAPESRDVRLKRGAAYFEVARNVDRPFVVLAGNTRVKVVGTEFEIWQGPDAVRVSVDKGRVEVMPQRHDSVDNSPPKILSAGDQVTSTLAGDVGEVTEFDPNETLAWRRGRFIYTDAALSMVIADINRYRHSKIALADPSLGSMRVTAAFGADDTDGFLEGFAEAEGFRLTILPDQTFLSRN